MFQVSTRPLVALDRMNRCVVDGGWIVADLSVLEDRVCKEKMGMFEMEWKSGGRLNA